MGSAGMPVKGLSPRDGCSRILLLGLRGQLLGTSVVSPSVLPAVRQRWKG